MNADDLTDDEVLQLVRGAITAPELRRPVFLVDDVTSVDDLRILPGDPKRRCGSEGDPLRGWYAPVGSSRCCS